MKGISIYQAEIRVGGWIGIVLLGTMVFKLGIVREIGMVSYGYRVAAVSGFVIL